MRFEFSESVRNALAVARTEAVRLNNDELSAAHLLLALIGDHETISIFESLRVDGDEVRRKALLRLAPGRAKAVVGELKYTPSFKLTLDFAMAEARESEEGTVTPKHLLLGLLRADVDVRVELAKLGLTVERIKGIGATKTSVPFRVTIDDASDRTIHDQIVTQIVEAVATGNLTVGERLPSVRYLADEIQVAPGTVAKAYRELERRGLVTTEGARGTRVAKRTPADTYLDRPTTLIGMLRPVAVTAYHLGSNARELREALEEAMRGIFHGADSAPVKREAQREADRAHWV